MFFPLSGNDDTQMLLAIAFALIRCDCSCRSMHSHRRMQENINNTVNCDWNNVNSNAHLSQFIYISRTFLPHHRHHHRSPVLNYYYSCLLPPIVSPFVYITHIFVCIVLFAYFCFYSILCFIRMGIEFFNWVLIALHFDSTRRHYMLFVSIESNK